MKSCTEARLRLGPGNNCRAGVGCRRANVHNSCGGDVSQEAASQAQAGYFHSFFIVVLHIAKFPKTSILNDKNA